MLSTNLLLNNSPGEISDAVHLGIRDEFTMYALHQNAISEPWLEMDIVSEKPRNTTGGN